MRPQCLLILTVLGGLCEMNGPGWLLVCSHYCGVCSCLHPAAGALVEFTTCPWPFTQ